MSLRLLHLAAVLSALAAVIATAGCGAAGSDEPSRTIAFRMPDAGPLKARAQAMRRAAQLELDAIDGAAGATRLKLVDGGGADSIATIDALSGATAAGAGELTVSLVPPHRRETGRATEVAGRPRILLLPPASLARTATASYAASGATGASAAATDSPLRPGTPDGRYVTDGMSADAYPPAGRAFFRKFAKEYGRAPDRFAIYGYESIGLLVDAIRRVEKAGEPVTRASVASAALAIRDRFSPVGHYDVLPSGQTTLYLFQVRGAGAPTGPASMVEALR
jgi:hypothetical protein